jgi:L-fuconolactonase
VAGIVLDHLAKPDLRRGELAAWRRDLTALARFPNVACKLSGLPNQAPATWTTADLDTALQTAGDHFGPERLLFGSDWPVCLQATSYQRWVECVRQWLIRYGDTGYLAVFGGNANTWYRLPPRPQFAKP